MLFSVSVFVSLFCLKSTVVYVRIFEVFGYVDPCMLVYESFVQIMMRVYF